MPVARAEARVRTSGPAGSLLGGLGIACSYGPARRRRHGVRVPGRVGATVTPPSARLSVLAQRDAQSAALVERLLRIAHVRLSEQHVDGEFVFTVTGAAGPGRGWQLRPAGTSLRYGAIAALGLLRLPESDQRAVLAWQTCHDLVGRMAKRLDDITNIGDVALLCWACAAAGHGDLLRAVDRLAELDRQDSPIDVVAAAWSVTALVEARAHAEVEEHLAAARRRLLAACGPAVYPHTTGGETPWYRAHVGSFADQVYPIQALARLHASADDAEALATANSVAGLICAAQGEAGQWWWHYDSRTGEVVEGYPVYSVHQHAMAPMALLDLADAGGKDHLDAVCRGLRWLADPSEADEDLVLDEPPITWRKVARGDRRKVVRGLRAASTRIHPGMNLPALDRVYRPGVVDHECRPYELGWLFLTWLA
jgi:hypothetical protein